MKRSIEKTLITGIAIAIGSILAIVFVSLWQTRRLQESAVMIRHTNDVIFKTQELLNMYSRYELGVKNYLLTGDSIFLDSLAGLDEGIHHSIAEIQELTADNESQQNRVSSLYKNVEENRYQLKQAVAKSRGRDLTAVAGLLAGSAKSGYSHQLRVICEQIIAEERRLLEVRREARAKRASELDGFLWGLTIAVVVLAIVFVQKARVDLANDRKTREKLDRFNKELESQVHRQTAELGASEEKYRSLFYKSPLPKWIYDIDTLKFLEVNDAAIQNYGYSQAEFRALTIRDIRPPEDDEDLLQDVDQARKGKDPYRNSSWRHITRDGSIIDVEITAHNFVYEGKKARMVVAQDITQRRRSEQLLQRLHGDLQKRAAELAASNGELERFAYIASHDLQEPLRMISSFLQLLQKRYSGHLDEKADQYIHYAVDGAERMKALILDLLEYSRAGTAKEEFKGVEMDEVMEEVGNIFREKMTELNASVHCGPLPIVRGDKVQLTQLLQNLIGNALKYHSDAPPVIDIRAYEEGEHWRFEVQDNGIGIDPMFFDKIFIIFQRLHNKSEYSGTGIGLAICKKIVERHGGRIWVQRAPEKGSIFCFTILKQP